jgi:glyoxylase-like metal-dependent hydrolase (beta-lactamase superfamily II)
MKNSLNHLCIFSKVSLAALTLIAAATAHAEAPMQKTQPGYYRMMLGGFEITALSDGTVALPVDKLLKAKPGQVEKLLAKSYLKAPVETSVNAYLINTGSKLVLVDTGAAGLFGPTLGKMLASMKAAGYAPEQVDEVYITHMHADHVGGLMAGDKMAFPNAVVRADEREGGFWLNKANMDAAPADAKGFFQGAMASTNAYVAAGKLKAFNTDKGAVELIPGISALAARGHTPGHSIFVAESQGQRMVFWGDLMHVAAVQFVDPTVTIQFDSDPKAAMPARKKNYADAAAKGYYVAITHISFPGIGKLRADGKGYQWLPANYSSAP